MKNPFDAKYARVQRLMRDVLPHAVARMAVNHFRDSFNMGKFNEPGSAKWAAPKRTDAQSRWYGFKLGAKARRPGVKARKFTDKDRRAKARGNFSKARTTNATMQVTGQLRDAIFASEIRPNRVVIKNSLKYSSLLNYGGKMRVFGHGGHRMPKRKFMGKSTALIGKIQLMARQELLKALRG